MTGSDISGALAHLRERATRTRVLNEFREPVTFSIQERVLPELSVYDDGIRTAIELHVGAAYVTYRGDNDMAVMYHKENAYAAIANLLYGDVLLALRQVIQAVGDGKRREAMELLGKLHAALRK